MFNFITAASPVDAKALDGKGEMEIVIKTVVGTFEANFIHLPGSIVWFDLKNKIYKDHVLQNCESVNVFHSRPGRKEVVISNFAKNTIGEWLAAKTDVLTSIIDTEVFIDEIGKLVNTYENEIPLSMVGLKSVYGSATVNVF